MTEFRQLGQGQERGLNEAASLAKKQLEYAEAIVDLARPGKGNDSVLIGAVLQAIATNYAATIAESGG